MYRNDEFCDLLLCWRPENGAISAARLCHALYRELPLRVTTGGKIHTPGPKVYYLNS